MQGNGGAYEEYGNFSKTTGAGRLRYGKENCEAKSKKKYIGIKLLFFTFSVNGVYVVL